MQAEPRPTLVSSRDTSDLGFKRNGSAGNLIAKQFPGFNGAGSNSLTQLLMNLGGRETISRPFIQNPWVFACVEKRAKAGQSTPGKVYRSEDDEAPEVTSGPLIDVLRKPNPLMSQRDLWKLTWNHLDLCGETFWVLLKRRGQAMTFINEGEIPDEIWPVRGDLMSLTEEDLDERTKLPKQWRTTTTAGEVIYPAHAVTHIYNIDPDNPLRGIGPLQALQRRLEIEFKAERFDEALVNNGGRPGAIIETDGMLTNEQVKSIREQYLEKNAKPEDDGKPIVLQNGKLTIPGFSPKDMQLGDLRIWNRDVVMALYGVTKPLLTITDDVNLANGREARKVFWESTIHPQQEVIADKITTHFLGSFNGKESEYRFEFDTSRVKALKDDQSELIERTVKIFQLGVATFNESAALAGWEIDEIEGGDERFKPSATSEPAAEPEPEPIEEEDPEAKSSREIPAPVTKVADPMEAAEARVAYAKAFDDGLVPHDKALAKSIKKWHTDYVKSVRRAFIDFADSGVSLSGQWAGITRAPGQEEWEVLLGDLTGFKEGLGAAVTPKIEKLLFDQAELLAKGELGVGTSLLNESTLFYREFVDSKVIQLTETLETVRDVVRDAVRSAITADGGLGSTSEQIRQALESVKGNLNTMVDKLGTRSELIARTETTSIANGARTEEMKLQGVLEHRWITASDGEVRESHQVDGEIQTVGQPFTNGLRHPGDPSAPVGEVANCRCTTSPVPPAE